MTLVIQTNISGRLGVWVLTPAGKARSQTIRRIRYHGSERLLAIVDEVIRSAGLLPKHVTRIIVVRGPGPFTAVRTGLVVANTLGWLWGKVVQGIVRVEILSAKDLGNITSIPRSYKLEPVRPWYGREPNITPTKQNIWV